MQSGVIAKYEAIPRIFTGKKPVILLVYIVFFYYNFASEIISQTLPHFSLLFSIFLSQR